MEHNNLINTKTQNILRSSYETINDLIHTEYKLERKTNFYFKPTI